MVFTISKISNHGTTHPVVARLHLQTFDLVNGTTLSNSDREAISKIYFEAGRRLLHCWDIRDQISAEIVEQAPAPQSDPRLMRLPHVIDLDQKLETFLYEAKNFLRGVVQLFELFFGTRLANASDLIGYGKKSKAIKCVECHLG